MGYPKSHFKDCALSCLTAGAMMAGLSAPRAAWAVNPDIPRIEAGAEKGSVLEELKLGNAYLTGRGVERNEKQAAYWYEKAANSGEPQAQREIGHFYMAGIGVERDPVRAVRWYERAIAGGLVSAKVNLGVAYLWGLGVQRDDAFAVKLFQEAAAKGSGAGAGYMGTLYYYGKCVRKDAVEARRWYELGSKLHDAPAEHDLALMLAAARNPSDRGRVVKLLRESAKTGYVPARYDLGFFLLRNPEFAKSRQEPVSLLEEAGREGMWKASVVLGIIARDGLGVPKDAAAAYYHFWIAKLQGGAAAAKLVATDLKVISAEFIPDQAERLKSEAAEWYKEHPPSLQYLHEDGEDRMEFSAFALQSPDRDIHAGRPTTLPPPLLTEDWNPSTP